MDVIRITRLAYLIDDFSTMNSSHSGVSGGQVETSQSFLVEIAHVKHSRRDSGMRRQHISGFLHEFPERARSRQLSLARGRGQAR